MHSGFFEKVSGMRINYAKSELITLGMDDTRSKTFADIFRGIIGTLPIKYPGVPLHYDKLRREDIQHIIDKILKRMAGWRGNKLLSYSGSLSSKPASLVF